MEYQAGQKVIITGLERHTIPFRQGDTCTVIEASKYSCWLRKGDDKGNVMICHLRPATEVEQALAAQKLPTADRLVSSDEGNEGRFEGGAI